MFFWLQSFIKWILYPAKHEIWIHKLTSWKPCLNKNRQDYIFSLSYIFYLLKYLSTFISLLCHYFYTFNLNLPLTSLHLSSFPSLLPLSYFFSPSLNLPPPLWYPPLMYDRSFLRIIFLLMFESWWTVCAAVH